MVIYLFTGIIVLLFLGLAGFSVKVKDNKKNMVPSSVEQSVCLKGFMALLIVFSHTHNYFSSIGLLKLFTPFGYIGVCVFYFYSGYGVAFNTWNKKDYFNGYLNNRAKKIYIPYLLCNITYFMILGILSVCDVSEMPSLFDIAISMTAIKRLLPYSWYVIIILIWYVLWYIVVKIFKNKKKCIIAITIIFLVYYVIGCSTEVPSFYYKSIISLVIGAWAGTYPSELTCRKCISRIITAFVFFAISVLLLWKNGYSEGISYSIIITMSSCAFTFVFMYLLRLLVFYSPLLYFVGNISYEIYLLQGVAYTVSKAIFKNNFIAFEILSISLIIVLSFYINKASKVVINTLSTT